MNFLVHIIFTIFIYTSGTNCLSIPLLDDSNLGLGDVLDDVLGDVLGNGGLNLAVLEGLDLDQIISEVLILITDTLNLGGGCLLCADLDIISTLASCLDATIPATENAVVGAISSVVCLFGECNGLGLLTPIDCPSKGCEDPSVDGPISSRRKRQANPLDGLFEYVDKIVCGLVNPVVASVLTLVLEILLSVLNP